MKITNKKEGISLIVLVVTIIVLAILATVVITSITEANIINQATNATESAHIADLKEQVELIKQEALIDENLNNGEGLDREKLLEILSQKFPGSVKDSHKITIENGKYVISVLADLGVVVFANATAPHPQQDKEGVVGLDYKGNLVDMDDWEWHKLEDGTYTLSEWTGSWYVSGYTGEVDANGKISSEIPAYIKDIEDTTFNPVTALIRTFQNCEELTQVPTIPSSVTDMDNTFVACRNLEIAPIIPENVTNMENTFYCCVALETAPRIPNSVTNMDNAFAWCENLKQAPTIPENVTNMFETFKACTKLIGTVRINSENVNNIEDCFYDITETLTVQVPAGSTTYDTLTAEYGTSGNIIIETF